VLVHRPDIFLKTMGGAGVAQTPSESQRCWAGRHGAFFATHLPLILDRT
jgi:hypothetical protein